MNFFLLHTPLGDGANEVAPAGDLRNTRGDGLSRGCGVMGQGKIRDKGGSAKLQKNIENKPDKQISTSIYISKKREEIRHMKCV